MMEFYKQLFAECHISDLELQKALIAFVEGQVLKTEFAELLNKDDNLKKFVEQAFAKKIAPIQELVDDKEPDPNCELCGGTGECETELYEGLVTCWRCMGE